MSLSKLSKKKNKTTDSASPLNSFSNLTPGSFNDVRKQALLAASVAIKIELKNTNITETEKSSLEAGLTSIDSFLIENDKREMYTNETEILFSKPRNLSKGMYIYNFDKNVIAKRDPFRIVCIPLFKQKEKGKDVMLCFDVLCLQEYLQNNKSIEHIANPAQEIYQSHARACFTQHQVDFVSKWFDAYKTLKESIQPCTEKEIMRYGYRITQKDLDTVLNPSSALLVNNSAFYKIVRVIEKITDAIFGNTIVVELLRIIIVAILSGLSIIDTLVVSVEPLAYTIIISFMIGYGLSKLASTFSAKKLKEFSPYFEIYKVPFIKKMWESIIYIRENTSSNLFSIGMNIVFIAGALFKGVFTFTNSWPSLFILFINIAQHLVTSLVPKKYHNKIQKILGTTNTIAKISRFVFYVYIEANTYHAMLDLRDKQVKMDNVTNDPITTDSSASDSSIFEGLTILPNLKILSKDIVKFKELALMDDDKIKQYNELMEKECMKNLEPGHIPSKYGDKDIMTHHETNLQRSLRDSIGSDAAKKIDLKNIDIKLFDSLKNERLNSIKTYADIKKILEDNKKLLKYED